MPDVTLSPAPAPEAPAAPVADAGPQTPQAPVFIDPQPLTLPPENTPAQTGEGEYFLQVETGTVYKTKEAAAAGFAEKDRYINELKQRMGELTAQQQELIRAMQQNRQPQYIQSQPQADPYQQRYQEAFQTFMDEMNLPEKEAAVLARREVATLRDAERRALEAAQQFTKQTWAQQFDQIRTTDPSFDVEQNPLVDTIFKAHGDKGPQFCYDLYKRLSGQNGTTSATPAVQSVVAPQVQAQQQALSAQRANQLDGLRSQTAAPAQPFQNLPQAVHEAARRGIMEKPNLANDPQWVRSNYESAVRLYNQAHGLTGQGGYR